MADKLLLSEQKSPLLFSDFEILEEECKKEGGRLVVEGKIQAEGMKNRNGRTYPDGLWQKVLSRPSIQEKIKRRCLFGELDHPGDGKTSLLRASHIVLEARVQGKDVFGKILVLKTPNGSILREILEAKSVLGISSRANGSLDSGGIVQDDLAEDGNLAWDFVTDESTQGAVFALREDIVPPTPEEVSEIYRNILFESKKDKTVEELAEFGAYLAVSGIKLKSVTDDAMKETAQHTMALVEQKQSELELELFGTNHESGSHGNKHKTEGNMSTLDHEKEREALLGKLREQVEKETVVPVKQQLEEIRGENKQLTERLAAIAESEKELNKLAEENTSLSEENASLKKKYETAVKLTEEITRRYELLSTDTDKTKTASTRRRRHLVEMAGEVSSMSKKLSASQKLIVALAEKGNSYKTQFEKADKRAAASIKLLEELVRRITSGKLRDKIQEALASFPENRRPAMEKLLVKCRTVEEIEEVVGNVKSLFEEKQGSVLRRRELGLPPVDFGAYEEPKKPAGKKAITEEKGTKKGPSLTTPNDLTRKLVQDLGGK